MSCCCHSGRHIFQSGSQGPFLKLQFLGLAPSYSLGLLKSNPGSFKVIIEVKRPASCYRKHKVENLAAHSGSAYLPTFLFELNAPNESLENIIFTTSTLQFEPSPRAVSGSAGGIKLSYLCFSQDLPFRHVLSSHWQQKTGD